MSAKNCFTILLLCLFSCNRITISDSLYMGMRLEDYNEVIQPCYNINLLTGARVPNGKTCITLGTGDKMEATPDFRNYKLVGLSLKSSDFSPSDLPENVLNYLTQKFGTPTSKKIDITDTTHFKIKVKYMEMTANWDLPRGLFIAFKGNVDQIKHHSNCNIEFSTSLEFKDAQYDKIKTKPQL